MILTFFNTIAIIVLLLSQNSCGFRLYESKADIHNIYLSKIESPPNSYVSNKIIRELVDNNINFTNKSPYILKINHEEFSKDIINTNSNSIIRGINLTLLVEYHLINNENQIIFKNSYSKSTIVNLDNVNMNSSSNQLEPDKIKLAKIVSEQILRSISNKLSEVQ